MDFLTDPIFTDLGRSDFIGGIDNEALDFGQLEQYMHVTAALATDVVADTNTSKLNSSASQINSTDANRSLSTVSARVSLGGTATTPIATPLNSTNLHNTQSHLPESPPDSGSEPPYSPLQDVHGLTLTTRELATAADLYNGPAADALQPHHTQHPLAPLAIHLSPQFTPPHHLPAPTLHQHQSTPTHFHHNPPAQHYLNASHATTVGQERSVGSVGEIRIKHEAGLIMNAANLSAPPDGATLEQQLLYSGTPYENEAIYAGHEYSNPLTTAVGAALGHTAICMLNADVEAPARVHVIGTTTPQPPLSSASSRSSAPTTPVHLRTASSRKRKMSTQIDCPDFGAGIKADPGLRMSPVAKSSCHTPHPYASYATEAQKLSPTSPVSISVPTSIGGCDLNTPALSTASLSPALSIVNSTQENSMDGSVAQSGENSDGNALTPCIRFSPFQPQNWHKLCDQSLQELSVVYYRVDADKGFNFSVSDDAFVCQKKNHFQVTCHARLQGEAKFVKTPSGLEKIKAFHLHFYGVKLEAPNQTIRVEQSQSDRSKKPFYPVPIDLQSHIVSKITVGRLHFSETTNNNMRKKGRPNPEQRYFQLVVGLHVHTMSGNFPIVSQGSERIIVRASNPGQFESDVDLCWQRGITQDSVFHAGRVGINTDRPDESLVVHGNLKVSGHIVQPSDSRAKQEIGELDTSIQLRNLQKIRIVRYRYEPEFAIHSGLRRASDSDSEEIIDTGVIAQEVREVIPDAVQEAGSIVLPNGSVIENFLLVNKDRILMENIGAVKELCKVTGSLENRIVDLERLNNRLMRAKEFEQKNVLDREAQLNRTTKNAESCTNRNLQIIIFLLVIIMAACLTAVSTLYFLEHNKQTDNHKRFERLQASVGHHEPALPPPPNLSEQEQQLLQLRHFLHSNASRGHATWPVYLFGLTTARPPAVPLLPADASTAAANNNTKPGSELVYNESGEFYAANGRTDELAVVMEKPLVSLQALPTHSEETTTSPPPPTLPPTTLPQRIATSAPTALRNNKTISSKNKSKWPLPQAVIRAASTSTATHNANSSPVNSNSNNNVAAAIIRAAHFEEALNVSESSSEKAGSDALPLDFENNSIDIDARQSSKKLLLNKPVPHLSAVVVAAATSIGSSSSSSGHSATLESAIVLQSAGTDINLRHNADQLASTSSSNSISVPDTTASAAHSAAAQFNVYKTVSPPPAALLVLTTHRQDHHLRRSHLNGSYALDVPALSNKSQGVLEVLLDTAADALDLQNLSNNNESADNPIGALYGISFAGRESVLGRRSTAEHPAANSAWMSVRMVQVDRDIGAPPQCKQTNLRAAVENCQSVCFEDSNQLASPQQHIRAPGATNKNIHALQTNSETIDEVSAVAEPMENANIAPGKISHATQAIAKQFSAELRQSDVNVSDDDDDTNNNDADADNLSASVEEHLTDVVAKVAATKNAAETSKLQPLSSLDVTRISVEPNRTPTHDCWKISSSIVANNKLNHTIGIEDFCPNLGKSLNLSFIIPLSRYFKELTLEWHLSSSLPLLWTICQDMEPTKRDGKLLTPTTQFGHNLPRAQNTSILVLNIPGHGSFVRDLHLRASDVLTKENLCQQQANEANTLLQYNIRFLRDCD